jgi:hypothetical protein
MKLDHLLGLYSFKMHLEDDEDFVYLYTDTDGIAIWRHGVSLEEILRTADRWIHANYLEKQQWMWNLEVNHERAGPGPGDCQDRDDNLSFKQTAGLRDARTTPLA